MSEWSPLEQEIVSAVLEAQTEDCLETIRIAALGKKGKITALLKNLAQMDPEERSVQGPLLNGMRDRLKQSIENRRQELHRAERERRLALERLDVTLPVRTGSIAQGRVHPISHVLEEVCAIFADMGFEIAEGSDIETDACNFAALNFPADHPARDMHDTFFLRTADASQTSSSETVTDEEDIYLLRTHTSPVQIRTLRSVSPPLRIIAPGKTYRRDSDQTHTPMFHQIEGLVIDQSSHLGHLRWVLENFCRRFFQIEELSFRFRPSFFPFTEPSFELDISCTRKEGRILLGEGDSWLEILGCGMVHPNVLENCGVDPNQYQGFAWGMGLDRIAMLKYGMPDLRPFFEADARWLKHYGFHPLDLLNLVGKGAQG